MNEPLINALACAIAVLDGTGGGYSSEEKQKAKEELQRLMMSIIKEKNNNNLIAILKDTKEFLELVQDYFPDTPDDEYGKLLRRINKAIGDK